MLDLRRPSGISPFLVITIWSAVTDATTPSTSEKTTAWESRATLDSMPVATNGDSGVNNGTAWRCMFDPINARFASSCSKNGIMLAATETNCFGDTSM